jgi:pimeloyl-ACP methyl ester carboxylesterase
MGAYESLLYADRNPDQVVGMVLLDPTPPDQEAMTVRVAPDFWLSDPEQSPLLQHFRRCADDMRNGSAIPGGADPNGCFNYPPFWPPVLAEALAEKASDPIQFESRASSLSSQAESGRLVVNEARDYRDMPMIVLTATEWPFPPDLSTGATAQARALKEAVLAAHLEYAALSSRGINALIPGANHYVQRSKPQVVIDAVEMVVREARQAD